MRLTAVGQAQEAHTTTSRVYFDRDKILESEFRLTDLKIKSILADGRFVSPTGDHEPHIGDFVRNDAEDDYVTPSI